jgi:hypothetical protein
MMIGYIADEIVGTAASREALPGGANVLPLPAGVRLEALRADNKAHVFTLYDRDTQASFQACALKALQDANPNAMMEIEKVWDWIQGQVLAYYYQVKAEIEAATTVSELAATQWDFAANAPTGERINLSDVLTMLAPAPA